MPIDKKKLIEIDKNIDQVIRKYPLLKRTRDEALFHLVTAYERFLGFDTIKAAGSVVGHSSLSKNTQDGIDFAIQWVYKFCPDNSTTNYIIKPKILKEAKQLLDASITYSHIWDNMVLLFKDMCEAEIKENNNIILGYKKDYRSDADIANRFLNPPDDLDSTIKQLETYHSIDLDSIVKEIDFKYLNKNLIYKLPASAFVLIFKAEQETKKHLLELDVSWDLGGYTVKDFTIFFSYLRCVTAAHFLGCMLMNAGKREVSNHCMRRTKEEWIKDIKESISVEETKIEKILSDLIYNFTLYGEGKKNPDVTYQPFIKMKDGSLLLINSLVQQSNFERNHWDLLSIIRPDLHSRLRNNKENLWRLELERFCDKIELKTKGPIEFSFDGHSSDIDLVLIDAKNKVLLLVELKWLTSPDRIKDIIYLSEELKKGLTQIEFALKYCLGSQNEFASKINIPKAEINQYRIFGLVLSKNSMGNRFTFSNEVPCINERIFKWILGDPHKKNLETLWRVANDLRYLPQENVHYIRAESNEEFAGYKFTSKDTAHVTIRPFDPRTDFNFDGL